MKERRGNNSKIVAESFKTTLPFVRQASFPLLQLFGGVPWEKPRSPFIITPECDKTMHLYRRLRSIKAYRTRHLIGKYIGGMNIWQTISARIAFYCVDWPLPAALLALFNIPAGDCTTTARTNCVSKRLVSSEKTLGLAALQCGGGNTRIVGESICEVRKGAYRTQF